MAIFFLDAWSGFKQNSSSAIYPSIRTDSKHKILEEPPVSDLKNKNQKIKKRKILDSINHKIYRFDNTEQSQLIYVNVKIGLPNTIIRWARLGLVTGIVLPIGVVSYTHYRKCSSLHLSYWQASLHC